MEKRGALTFGILLAAVLAAISALAWPHIPDTAPVAVHFGLDGRANGFWPKWAALAFGPLLVLGLTLFFAATRNLRVSGDADAGNRRAFDLVSMAAAALAGAAHLLILLRAEGRVTDTGAMLTPVAALFLMVTGNVMGKLRRNGAMGVRTPWSLASDYAWEKSNRIAGRLFVALGIAVLLADMLFAEAGAARLLLAGSLAVAALAAALSWHYWRRDPMRTPPGA